MYSADGRLRRLGVRAGAGVVILWLAFIVYELTKHGFGDDPLPSLLLALIGGVLLFFVVSEWTRSVGSLLRRRTRPPDRRR